VGPSLSLYLNRSTEGTQTFFDARIQILSQPVYQFATTSHLNRATTRTVDRLSSCCVYCEHAKISAPVSSGFKYSLRDACMYDESRPTSCKRIPAPHFPERFGSPRTV